MTPAPYPGQSPLRPRRPTGLIFAAIALGLFTLSLLGSAAISIIGIFFGTPSAAAVASGPPLPPHFITAALAGSAAFFLVLAAWSIATIVGLLRLRNWARYSILIMGALIAFFGITSGLFIAFLPSIVAASDPQQALPPGVMHGIIAIIALFYIAIGAVGIWWLVYFNLRSVKSYFLPYYASHYASPQPNPYTAAYPSYSTAASLATPGGLAPPLPATPVPVPPPAGRFAHVPTSIKIVGCLFFFGALACLVFVPLPFPAFVAGFILPGWAGHLLYLAIAAVNFLLGFGLFRLDNRARLGVYALVIYAVANAIVMRTPWGYARYTAYSLALHRQMHLPPTPPGFDPSGGPILTFTLILSLVLYALIIYVIERHRALFTTPAHSRSAAL